MLQAAATVSKALTMRASLSLCVSNVLRARYGGCRVELRLPLLQCPMCDKAKYCSRQCQVSICIHCALP